MSKSVTTFVATKKIALQPYSHKGLRDSYKRGRESEIFHKCTLAYYRNGSTGVGIPHLWASIKGRECLFPNFGIISPSLYRNPLSLGAQGLRPNFYGGDKFGDTSQEGRCCRENALYWPRPTHTSRAVQFDPACARRCGQRSVPVLWC